MDDAGGRVGAELSGPVITHKEVIVLTITVIAKNRRDVIPAKAGSRRQESEQTIGFADGPEGELQDATRNPVKYEIHRDLFYWIPVYTGMT